ncbi:hypothetical protein ACSFXN_19550 [Planococcus sp. 1R117A]|uniref:hypothetical protein n=1 Tax=Planococcus sp. 1R117A TaxID=3447020 RepID=UPI003EDCA880
MDQELLIDKIMRINNMDKDGMSLIIFERLETYYKMSEKYGDDIENFYKEHDFRPAIEDGYPKELFDYFSFTKEDIEASNALAGFSVTTASYGEWNNLKEVFLKVAIRKKSL